MNDMNGSGHTSAAPTAAAASSSLPDISDASILDLLQRFLKLQSTRVSISAELTSAFEEPHITDAALDRVIQISSLGLLEVKNEVAEILAELEQNRANDAREEIFSIKEVERLEGRRLEEVVKGLQLQRVTVLKRDEMDEDARRDADRALQDSRSRVGDLVQEINEVLQDVRASVADRSEDR